MKNIIITWLLPVICILGVSCDRIDGPEIFSFAGKAQKGPFITGTTITLNELNLNLGQTGKSFTTTITDDDGSFELNNIELNSDLALLTANGFYFSEVYGVLSSAALTLQAITDFTNKEKVNINVFTHIIKGRVENLVNSGQSFHDANEQAKSELLTFLNAPESFNEIDFDELDISQNNEYNAVLLAFSIILQRYTRMDRTALTAELTQLLTNLGTDFRDDGRINNQSLIDTLMYNISLFELIDIRKNIEKRYTELDISTTIADFETYVNRFQEKHSKVIYTSFYYPAVAPTMLEFPYGGILPNLLSPDDSVYNCTSYSVAAIIPLYSTLEVKFIKTSIDSSNRYFSFGYGFGWKGRIDADGTTLIAQRQNTLLETYIHFENPGTATIEYYENNNTELPTFTKNIRWGTLPVISDSTKIDSTGQVMNP